MAFIEYVRADGWELDPDNILLIHGINPPVLKSHYGLYRAVMHGRSPLTRQQRELLAVVISAANDCHYWVLHHGAWLRRYGFSEDLIEKLSVPRAGGLEKELSAADWALVRYALKLNDHPGAIDKADIDALRKEGFDDRGIHDACQVVAYFNYVNRVADGLGVELESRFNSDE